MGTKRRAGIVGVLCGTCLVFAVMLGRTGIARAGDGEVPPPKVEGTWQEEHVRFQPVERTPYKRDDGAAKGAAAAHQPSASTKRSILPEEPLKETVAGVVARQALPWVAGILALAGVVMVAYGFWARRRPSSHQMARSITRLQISEVAAVNGPRSAHAKLAGNLVRTEMPPLEIFADHQTDHRTEQPKRRAA
jgi:hypothetical protein